MVSEVYRQHIGVTRTHLEECVERVLRWVVYGEWDDCGLNLNFTVLRNLPVIM